MGKIRVQDLAKKMGIPNQDLVFKLKSIGVRVEGDDAHIDTDIISAILSGKKLPHPREVILRDEPAPSGRALRATSTKPGSVTRMPAAASPVPRPTLLRPSWYTTSAVRSAASAEGRRAAPSLSEPPSPPAAAASQ